MDPYEIWLLLIGLVCFGAAWVPHVVHGKPISFPIVYVAFGAAVFSLPLGLWEYDPRRHRVLTERLTELIVIVALTGVGLKRVEAPVANA